MYQIGWFSTARGPTSRLLLQRAQAAIEEGYLDARIAFVFCNREPGESEDTDLFIEQVHASNLPLITLSSTRFRDRAGANGTGFNGRTFAPWREAYDWEALKCLEPFHSDLALLAGYMLVMTPPLCRRCVTINLHPAPPGGPTGTWQQVIDELIRRTSPSAGAYMHLVTPELDLGPVVTHYTFPIQGEPYDRLRRENPDELAQLIRAEGVRREPLLILETLRAFSKGEVAVCDGQPVDRDRRPIASQDLTEAIETRLNSTVPAPRSPLPFLDPLSLLGEG